MLFSSRNVFPFYGAASKSLPSINMSKCDVGAAGIAEVAKFMGADASVASISLSGNMITGSTDIGHSYMAKYDLDLSGIRSDVIWRTFFSIYNAEIV